MSEELKNNNEEPKKTLVEKFKAMSKEDKIMASVIAVIAIVVLIVCISYGAAPIVENKHQQSLRAEVEMPECEHIKEAQNTLFETKEKFKEKMTNGGFDEYWETYEKNFWIEFKKTHVNNYPDCFAAQNAE